MVAESPWELVSALVPPPESPASTPPWLGGPAAAPTPPHSAPRGVPEGARGGGGPAERCPHTLQRRPPPLTRASQSGFGPPCPRWKGQGQSAVGVGRRRYQERPPHIATPGEDEARGAPSHGPTLGPSCWRLLPAGRGAPPRPTGVPRPWALPVLSLRTAEPRACGGSPSGPSLLGPPPPGSLLRSLPTWNASL